MDRFRGYLSDNGMKYTRQRAVIGEVFFSSGGHLSIDEVLHLAQGKMPSIGYATVYRTMKLLAESGLASGHRFGSDYTRYEPAYEGHHHDHLVCVDCGSIIEFEDDEIERLQEAVARQYGFAILSHRHVILGRCSDCQAKQPARTGLSGAHGGTT